MSDKKKKKKVVYYDDGRTIADMSGLYGAPSGDEADATSGSNNQGNSGGMSSRRPGNTFKDKLATYWNTVKTLFLPMLATLGIIGGAYLILWLLLEIASFFS